MSNAENDKLRDLFLSDYEQITICPYCGDSMSEESYRGCCGEVHPEKVWDKGDGSDYLTDDELEEKYQEWLIKREDAEPPEHRYTEPEEV